MSDLSQRIAALPLEKRALLEQQFKALQAANTPAPILALPDDHPSRLSFAQERLWFLSRFEPDDYSFNEPSAWRLTGALDAGALLEALRAVVARHEALRTVYRLEDGIPLQVILPEWDLTLEQVDLASLAPDARLAAVEARFPGAIARPFDLETDLMLRATLFRLADDDHVLLLVKHHIACDGWSGRLLTAEMVECYAALREGRAPRLPELPVQYRDYAAWQRDLAAGDALKPQLDYWRNQLAGLTPMELPSDRPLGARLSARGESEFFDLAADLTGRVNALGAESNVTPFMMLLTACAILLCRYSGQDDVALGTIIANRRQTQIENLIGPFINTLVLRVSLADDPTVRELLARVRGVTLAAYDHQDMPFELLLEELQPNRDAWLSPLFRALMVHQSAPATLPGAPGLTMQKLPAPVHTAKLPLSLYLTETATGVQGRFEYSTNLFDAETIRRMAAHLKTLLRAMTDDPDRPISQTSMLPDAERRLVLETWNDTATAYAETRDVVQQFDARAAQQPKAVAFLADDATLSYAELHDRANRLAHYLIADGVRPGDRVGVAVEKSPDAPVALLAVFKAGGVYVPLDPHYPAERLRFMIEDSGVARVITRERWLDALAGAPAEFICLDRIADALAQQPVADLQPDLAPDAPAYIVYTSGSTGAPKGALIPHRQILNRLNWMWAAYPQQPGDVGSVKSALSFVDSLWELLGYLLQGTPAAIISDDAMRDPHALVEALARAGVTQVWLVPSLLRVLLDTVPDLAARLPRLLFWVSTGEVLPRDLDLAFHRALPHATLYNLYGTSEVWDATWYDPAQASATDHLGERVPIGRPIGNVRAYVLDAQGQPSPIGVPGELYIGGGGLSDGYVNRPELTAERFLPDPYMPTPGARMYRTGDLARWLPDGNIELVGRADHQVKIRGWRVEPGEIEALLRRQETIKDAVVTADGEDATRRLIAYVVPQAGSQVDLRATRDALARALPLVLIPGHIIVLDAFPTTPSGKINRKALPPPEVRDGEPGAASAAPVGATETRLVRLWAEMLKLDTVGIHDDFFALGGHSLLGVRLFARIEEEFGRRLPLSLIFSAPTIAQLAHEMNGGQEIESSHILATIQRGGDLPPFFCVHGFGGGVVGYGELARRMREDQPFYGFQARGADGKQEPDTSVEAMAARYIEAMRTVQPHGPYRVGGYCYGGVVAYEMARQLEALGEETALVAIIEGFTPKRFQTRTARLDPRRLKTIWHSMPYWAKDYASMDRAWLMRAVRSRIARRLEHEPDEIYEPNDLELAAIAGSDLTGVPTHHQRLMRLQLLALRSYNPRPYGGRVTLFRSDWQSVGKAVFGALDPEYGWGQLAAGGVEIRLVQGAHRNIHMAPHVNSLADQLMAALEAVKSR